MTENTLPAPGTKLDNGATVIIAAHASGDPANRFVLALREGAVQPFVVWRLTAEGDTVGGGYCSTLARAVVRLYERTGRSFGLAVGLPADTALDFDRMLSERSR